MPQLARRLARVNRASHALTAAFAQASFAVPRRANAPSASIMSEFNHVFVLLLIFIPIFRPTCWYLWLRDEGAPFVPSASLGTNLILANDI
jgi:hypothetical protein